MQGIYDRVQLLSDIVASANSLERQRSVATQTAALGMALLERGVVRLDFVGPDTLDDTEGARPQERHADTHVGESNTE